MNKGGIVLPKETNTKPARVDQREFIHQLVDAVLDLEDLISERDVEETMFVFKNYGESTDTNEFWQKIKENKEIKLSATD